MRPAGVFSLVGIVCPGIHCTRCSPGYGLKMPRCRWLSRKVEARSGQLERQLIKKVSDRCRPRSDIRTADQCQAAYRPTPDHQFHQYPAAVKCASLFPIRSTTHRRPDVALAFFTSARHASPGAGSRIRAKGGICPKTLVSAVFPLSALSVLCFCERRLSHDPLDLRGFRDASMNSKLGGRGDWL